MPRALVEVWQCSAGALSLSSVSKSKVSKRHVSCYQTVSKLLPDGSHQLPNVGAGVPVWSSHLGSVVDTAALGKVSSEYFAFLCHSFITPAAQQSSPSITWDWYNRPINDHSNSGLGSTPGPQINNNKKNCVRFKVFMVVTMKNGIWGITPCDSCKNRRFGGI
jgi:hypothetical protein